mmetsp:Transcript_45738/g.148686  ORF Transcript_45738/g.148686 Transcript_45738/m.148686 type:complete len:238 (+) Transcript_45738:259-972(+)
MLTERAHGRGELEVVVIRFNLPLPFAEGQQHLPALKRVATFRPHRAERQLLRSPCNHRLNGGRAVGTLLHECVASDLATKSAFTVAVSEAHIGLLRCCDKLLDAWICTWRRAKTPLRQDTRVDGLVECPVLLVECGDGVLCFLQVQMLLCCDFDLAQQPVDTKVLGVIEHASTQHQVIGGQQLHGPARSSAHNRKKHPERVAVTVQGDHIIPIRRGLLPARVIAPHALEVARRAGER